MALCEVCHKRIEQDEAVYRVHRWERQYAHALCVDRGAHLHKAILLGREMRGSIEPGLALLEWTESEKRQYVWWASAALRALKDLDGVVDDVREFIGK